MNFIHRLIRNLVLPSNAGPFDPKYVSGPDVPAVLNAYYVANYGLTVVYATLWYWGGNPDNPYYYECNLTDPLGLTTNHYHAEGRVVAGAVHERQITNWESTVPSSLEQWGINDAATLKTWWFTGAGAANWPSPMTSIVQIDDQVDLQMSQVSQGRGPLDYVQSTANSAAIGAEAVVFTSNTVTWRNGRAFAIDTNALCFGSVANFALVQVRRTNLAGALISQSRFSLPAGGAVAVTCYTRIIVTNTSGADITGNIVLTLTASAGTVTQQSGGFPTIRWLRMLDIGAADNFSGTHQI